MSLFSPPAGFPAHLACFWPLIWVQILLLRAAVRAAYGRGVQYRWGVSPNGRVFLASIDWMPGQKPASLQTPQDRLAAACSGEAYAPAFITDLSISAQPGEGRGPDRHAPHSVALDPGLCRDERNHWKLPAPET